MRGTKLSALPMAVGIGLVLALIAAVIRVYSNPPGPLKWVAVLIYAACLAGSFIVLAWVVIVDRRTLPGATKHPELAVESHWYRSAASASFMAIVAAAGIGVFVFDGVVSYTLAVVVAFGFVVYVVAYLWEKNR